MIDNKQMTICWHVDDLFVGHDDPNVVTTFLEWLVQRYDTDDKKLNVDTNMIISVGILISERRVRFALI